MFESEFETVLVGETLVVRGAVEDYAVVALRRGIAEHSAEHTRSLTVDLSGVSYLPSVAVGVLVRAIGAARREGANIDVVAPSGSMSQRVLALAGVPHRGPEGDQDPPEVDAPA